MPKAFKAVLASVLATLMILGAAGVAFAVSGGGYDPGSQDCSPSADSTSAKAKTTEPNCHNFKVNLSDSQGNRYAELGLDQLPAGYDSTPGLFGVGVPGSPNFPHAGCASVNTNGTRAGKGPGDGCGNTVGGLGISTVFDTQDMARTTVTPEMGTIMLGRLLVQLLGGTDFYMGADDNLDAGEHDGVSGKNGTNKSANGPSDGGAVTVRIRPNDATTAPTLTNPLAAAGASEGFCADGICQEITTQRQTVYRGNPNGHSSRAVSDYSNKQFDPYTCSSGSPADEKTCNTKTKAKPHNPGSMNDWRNADANNVYADPGVQIYEDPDPQASPIDPFYDGGAYSDPMLYPLIGAYAGTCGVILGGGPLWGMLGMPQVIVPTGC